MESQSRPLFSLFASVRTPSSSLAAFQPFSCCRASLSRRLVAPEKSKAEALAQMEASLEGGCRNFANQISLSPYLSPQLRKGAWLQRSFTLSTPQRFNVFWPVLLVPP